VRTLGITVPPNAEGVLVLDSREGLRVSEGGELVWFDGVFSAVPGVIGATVHDNTVLLTLGSGTYSFVAKYRIGELA
jgi:hypothetical protein